MRSSPACEGLESRIERLTGGPEFQVGGAQARESSVRPDEHAMELGRTHHLLPGRSVTTDVLKERFGGWGRSGKKAFSEIDAYQQMVRSYMKALDETVELGRQEA